MDAHYPPKDHVTFRLNITLRGYLITNYRVEINDLFNRAG